MDRQSQPQPKSQECDYPDIDLTAELSDKSQPKSQELDSPDIDLAAELSNT